MQDANELVFELKGKTPDQMPIARLAAYMKEFAALLGGKEPPMFSAVRRGSTCIAATLPASGGMSAARKRVYEASKGFGPKEAQKAFDALTALAEADRAPARVLAKSGTVIHLPRSSNYPRPLSVHERGSITGRLTGMVDDKAGGAKARIRPMDGGPLVFATASGRVADGLGTFFRKYVRIYGFGEWRRNEDGKWLCAGIEISEIHTVDNVNVVEAITSIRELPIAWSENPFDEFDSDVNSA